MGGTRGRQEEEEGLTHPTLLPFMSASPDSGQGFFIWAAMVGFTFHFSQHHPVAPEREGPGPRHPSSIQTSSEGLLEFSLNISVRPHCSPLPFSLPRPV